MNHGRSDFFAPGEQVKSFLLTLSPSYAYIVGMADLLGTFEQAVLLAILRLGQDAYGRAILRQVQVSLARSVVAGAVYTT